MADLTSLSLQLDVKTFICRAIIETPKGCRNKFDYDPETDLFMLGGLLPEGMIFPFDFGFLPSTLGEDDEPVKTIEVLPLGIEPRIAREEITPSPKIESKVAVRPLHKMPKAAAKERGEEKKANAAGARKADVFTERVTLQISHEMRDDVERLARELRRAKVSQKERITGNTVMRVAIRLMTERFALKPGEGPNDEAELFECVEKALAKR